MSVGNRIRTLRRSLNMSQPELAKKSNVGQSTISDLENDKKGTSAENMEAIASALGTNTLYLLKGYEEKMSAMDKIIELERNFKYQAEEERKEVLIKFFDDIPLLNGADAYFEYFKTEAKTLSIKEMFLKQRNIKTNECFALVANSDSMFPTIKNSDIVYIDIGRDNIKDGKVFAVCHGGLFKFKRLYQLPLGGVRIVSDNAAEYPEERLSAQEIIDQQFEVIGWAWSWQSMESW